MGYKCRTMTVFGWLLQNQLKEGLVHGSHFAARLKCSTIVSDPGGVFINRQRGTDSLYIIDVVCKGPLQQFCAVYALQTRSALKDNYSQTSKHPIAAIQSVSLSVQTSSSCVCGKRRWRLIFETYPRLMHGKQAALCTLHMVG